MNLTQTSKFISLILRHKPETIGISLDEHGWAKVDELIAGIVKKQEMDCRLVRSDAGKNQSECRTGCAGEPQFNMEMLREIVRTDNKQRYSFNEDETLIRANQGHSIPVDVELEEAEPPEELWHGTGEKYVPAIDKQGLLAKNRLYVHLSKDEDTAFKVGQRHGKPVLYVVKAGEMHRDGYKFYISKNGVWLTKEVPVKYLQKKSF